MQSSYFNREVSFISSMDNYLDAMNEGGQPLYDFKNYEVDIQLRIDIQNQLFGKSLLGKGDIVKANDKYYHWCWENKLNVCEECGKPLHNYWSGYISHILSRGSNAQLAHDPRNSRILCNEHHELAENENTHRLLKIYQVDLIIIEILKHEYSQN